MPHDATHHSRRPASWMLLACAVCWMISGQESRAQTLLWSAEGQELAEYLGTRVAAVSDYDGDLVPDVAVSSPDYDGLAGPNVGRVAIYSAVSGQLILAVEGDVAGAHLGASMVGVGDLDGDGLGDLVIGAPDYYGPGGFTGRVFLLSRSSGQLIPMADGEAGVWPGDAFGTSLDDAGDIDGDSVDDILVGAPRHNGAAGGWSGKVYLLSGASFSQIRSWEGDVPWCLFGDALASVGDLDADGLRDVIVGAPYHRASSPPYGGKAFVFSSGTGQLIWSFEGQDPIGESAAVVGSAGDVDLDGVDDLIVAAPEVNLASFNSGNVIVYSGATGALIWLAAGSLEDELFGCSVAVTNDLDHDGVRDIIVGSRGAFGDKGWAQGAITFLSGATGQTLLTIEGEEPYDGYGISVAVLSDLNGDGTLDLAIGAWGHDSSGTFENGKVYVVLVDPAHFLVQPPHGRASSPPSKSRGTERASFFPAFRGRIDLDDHE